MYRNVGGKIKGIAIILYVIGIIASAVGGTVFANILFDGIIFLLVSLLFTGIGVLASWIGTISLYGYGELIESSSQTRDYLEDVREIIIKMAENQGVPVDSFIDSPEDGEDAQEEYDEEVNIVRMNETAKPSTYVNQESVQTSARTRRRKTQ